MSTFRIPVEERFARVRVTDGSLMRKSRRVRDYIGESAAAVQGLPLLSGPRSLREDPLQ